MSGQIGGGWTVTAALREGERVVQGWRANRSQGWRSVGGRLWLTSARLVFTPNRLDAATGGRPWEADLAGVMDVGKAAPTMKGGPLSGGARTRLSVGLAGEGAELFVVPKVDEVVSELRRAIESSPGGR